jgi:hypothetical protein
VINLGFAVPRECKGSSLNAILWSSHSGVIF